MPTARAQDDVAGDPTQSAEATALPHTTNACWEAGPDRAAGQRRPPRRSCPRASAPGFIGPKEPRSPAGGFNTRRGRRAHRTGFCPCHTRVANIHRPPAGGAAAGRSRPVRPGTPRSVGPDNDTHSRAAGRPDTVQVRCRPTDSVTHFVRLARPFKRCCRVRAGQRPGRQSTARIRRRAPDRPVAASRTRPAAAARRSVCDHRRPVGDRLGGDGGAWVWATRACCC